MLSEKQSTRRSPMRPIEVSYVSKDAATGSVNDYQFNFPTRWTSDQSTNKVIGLRRLKYTPWSGNIGFNITVYDDENTAVPIHTVRNLKFTSANNLEECIVAIEDKAMWEGTVAVSDGNGGFTYANHNFACYIYYDGTTVKINVENDEEVLQAFSLSFDETKCQYSNNFLKLFNQDITDANTAKLTTRVAAGGSIEFTNVWNRQDLYFHSSFSDSTRQIMGCNGDSWDDPSVFYSAALNSNVWTLRFTQDTETAIIPKNGVLLVQFSLIFNCLRYLD